jgi:hypothetical protein
MKKVLFVFLALCLCGFVFAEGGREAGGTLTTAAAVEQASADFTFWRVLESWIDTQRDTKLVIDAGVGNTFSAADLDADSFRVQFTNKRYGWDVGTLTPERGRGFGDRIISDVYVVTDLDAAIAEWEMRDIDGPQGKATKANVGRYLVIEMFSEKAERDAGFVYDADWYEDSQGTGGVTAAYTFRLRLPGVESGHNAPSPQDNWMRHDTTYSVSATNLYYNANGQKTRVVMPAFKQATTKYNGNENEFLPGEIGIWLNRMESIRVDTQYGNDGFIMSRFYDPFEHPVGTTTVTGKRPLYIWLHGNDGRRIPEGREGWFSDTNGVPPEFLQNYGSLIATGAAGALVSGYTQAQYGGFFVLAIQAPNGGVTAPGYMDVINYIISQNPEIDTTRIYIAGHSMGGSGTTTMVNAYPEFFAAAMTAAGGRIDEEQAKVWSTPAWFWHNRIDSNGGTSTIINYNNLKNAGFDDVRLTYYPNGGYMNGINGVPTPEYESYSGPASNSSGGFGWPNDPVVSPGTQNPWGHSVFEPMISNLETVDGPWNVGFTNKAASDYTGAADAGGRRAGYVNFQWGVKNPLDTAGDTAFDWVFKQVRN